MNASAELALTQTLRSAPRFARGALQQLKHLQVGELLVTTPEGELLHFRGPQPGPAAHIVVRDWKAVNAAVRSGDIGVAEAYRDGLIQIDDVTAFLELFVRNVEALEKLVYGGWLGRIFYWMTHLMRPNTRNGSRKNIHAHYDLGNDFYSLWLGKSMTYSSALFEGDHSRGLEAAQDAKYERILEVIDAKPGERILEIGCGWGGFAEYAARTRGVHVHGITVSQAQLDFARARIEKQGLQDLVELTFTDYRDATGSYDYIVSIEMFEAVGERYWPTYFKTLHDRLKSGGLAVVQTITIADNAFDAYRRTSDFIRQYIFPGGMLPCPARFGELTAAAGLETRGTCAFGLDYAETLKRWRHRFNTVENAVDNMGFDHAFRQIWRFYLSYCEAGFRTGRTDVMQIELRRQD